MNPIPGLFRLQRRRVTELSVHTRSVDDLLLAGVMKYLPRPMPRPVLICGCDATDFSLLFSGTEEEMRDLAATVEMADKERVS